LLNIKGVIKMRSIRIGLWMLAFCAIVATAAEAYRERPASRPEPAGAQDVIGLDRRISSLEQRLYTIESAISRLEQQAIVSSRSAQSQTSRDPEIDRLRSEVTILTARVRELECGVAHLDERTLSASAKEARRRAGAQPKDPCRLNAEAPVQLSTRQ
jgi:predicted RNase H-like nuclease (RuvC/YqgF family)